MPRKFWKKGRGKPTAAKAVRAVKSLARRIKPEIKMFDFPRAIATITSTPVVFSMSDMTQGTDIMNYIGRRAQAKSLVCRFSISSYSNAVFNYLRTVIFCDSNDNNNTTPVAAEILDDSTNYLSQCPARNSLNRFKILHDKVYCVSGTGDSHNQSIKLRLPVNRTLTWAASGEQDKNHLYCLVMSTDATNGPSFQFYSRLYFSDS